MELEVDLSTSVCQKCVSSKLFRMRLRTARHGCYDRESLEQCKWIKLNGGPAVIDRSSSPYLLRSPMHLSAELQPRFAYKTLMGALHT